MISLFNKTKNTSPPGTSADAELTDIDTSQSSVSLIPGSVGEHALQDKFGTRQRALKFYDKQMLGYLSPLMQEFIAVQEVMFVATADSQGECDCSARFGKPGFVRVINKDFLIYPEYRGNGVLASQGNIFENPHIGMIFVDFFATTVGLHVNGPAHVIENDQLAQTRDKLPQDMLSEMQLEGKKKPDRWIMVEVEEAYIHCSKHVPLLQKLDKKIEWGTDDMVAKGGDFFQLGRLSLYDKIGGESAVKKAVDVLYRKIMADPEISCFFENEDIITLIERLKVFLSLLFGSTGGQYSTDADDLGEAYRHLVHGGISDMHFERLLVHLHSSLNQLGVPNYEIDSVMEMLEGRRAVNIHTPY